MGVRNVVQISKTEMSGDIEIYLHVHQTQNFKLSATGRVKTYAPNSPL